MLEEKEEVQSETRTKTDFRYVRRSISRKMLIPVNRGMHIVSSRGGC